MSKVIDSLVQATLNSKSFTGVVLARLEFANSGGFLRFSNSYQTIYWDEGSPLGEMPYYGVGELGTISVLPETSELGAINVQLTLSGIPNTMITDGFSDDYRNQPVYIWYATLDPDTYAVQGGQTGPVLAFAGLMDYATIEFGERATVTINATSRLADWERPRGGTFNHHYQTTYVDPTDDGFKSILAIQNREVIWGGLGVESFTGGGGNAGGVGVGGRCFAYGTKFLMQDESVKEIQDIEVGDIMLYGGKVEQIMKGYGQDQEWYRYFNIEVTGTHPVQENGKWIYIRDSKHAKLIKSLEYTYALDNENMLMMTENRILFSDYKMFPEKGWEEVMDMMALDFQNSRDEVIKQEIEKLKT